MHPAAYIIIIWIIWIILEILIFNSIYLTPETRKEQGWRLWLAISVALMITICGSTILYIGVYGNRKSVDTEYGWFDRKKKEKKIYSSDRIG